MKRLLFLLASLLIISSCSNDISDFESCIAAGYPAMESYPRQCNDGDNTYTEVLEGYKLDSIQLMKHSSEGYYGCFGCNQGADGMGLCVDPVKEMVPAEETPRLYCDSEFKLRGLST
jgi:hypothetical protein